MVPTVCTATQRRAPPPVARRVAQVPTDLPHDDSIRVHGAHLHNLHGVDVAIPRDRLAVFTGVSGSGKSSLAFGTIYAEAQRRYFESVAPYARRLINQVEAPKVQDVTGLPPAVALQQSRGATSTRSSVGTVTTLSNTVRMLFSRAGTYPGGAPRLDSDSFSPNTVAGACPECHGLGHVHRPTEALMVPDPTLSIREKAIASWPGAWLGKNLRDILDTLGYDVDRPWQELPATDREWILFTDEEPVVTVHPVREAGRIQRPYQGQYQSAARHLMHTLSDSKSATARRRALQFVETVPCPVCRGRRLRPEALAVTVAGRSIDQWWRLPLEEVRAALQAVGAAAEEGEVAAALVPDLVARLDVLLELGLGYLSMDRSTPTLSAGELQRLRLATQLRSGLFGVVYVLDEPSAGLHPADTEPLLRVLDRLVSGGNSLLIVEHDLEVMRRADWLVDVGPGAGEAGGEVLYAGPVPGLEQVALSVTRRSLFPDKRTRDERPPREPHGILALHDVRRHNLRGLDVSFPLGILTAVTGVSGSGKTTLLRTLADVLAAHLGTGALSLEAEEGEQGEEPDDAGPEAGGASTEGGDQPAAALPAATGLDQVHRVVRVDQKPIGRTPRSNLATYTGLFDGVRKLFAQTEEAKRRRYGVGRFSFNVKGGRCETCQGEGFVSVELLFLPGTYRPCPTCHGRRYNPETLEVTWHGRTIADVLDLSVAEAAEVFAEVKGVSRSLQTLVEVGLGYLHLGQPATELSGGEAQRIKLATELQRSRRRGTVYLLDEPTTGLHPADVEVLMRQLQGLVDGGSTVVLVEHDMAVVAQADHVIDLGPGAGNDGGQVVAAGSPVEVAAAEGSRTAPFLAAQV
ncbi:MAG TPA: excinuclease ABC subunit UvrA [Segeticoccus sp.]|uniref:excinuclease ABC subunit UvrA n=1 Tax=Segeticoccus sp. TaxID=2706531 RepID=UPI002D7E673A|nr:excinuclease ABC subunit UvrA [Segeticoccus sp.]HET8600470.1 excinuclease ABC subunit UvrA [Segeticoccus sp.]